MHPRHPARPALRQEHMPSTASTLHTPLSTRPMLAGILREGVGTCHSPCAGQSHEVWPSGSFHDGTEA